MKPLQKALGLSAQVLKSCSKAAVAVSHFVVSKVIGAGGSVTIQSLLLATNAWILYAGTVSLLTTTSVRRIFGQVTPEAIGRSHSAPKLTGGPWGPFAMPNSMCRSKSMEKGSLCKWCQALDRP